MRIIHVQYSLILTHELTCLYRYYLMNAYFSMYILLYINMYIHTGYIYIYLFIYDGVWQTSWNPCFLTQLLQVFHGELLRVVLVKPPGVKPRTMGYSTAEPATNQLEESREMNMMWINKIYSTHLSRVYTTYLWFIIVLTTKKS